MSFVDRIILPGGGRRYSGTNSKGLIWLRSKSGNHFPNHMIRKTTKTIILYCHGNGGSLGDFKSIVSFYSQWFNSSIFAVEYPSYGPAEGDACEETVNDNVRTAFEFLRDTLGYPVQNIVIMGYSIGTGPTIHLAADLCENGTPPAAIVTIAAFLSICDIVRDLKRSLIVYFADAIANRWNSGERIKKVTCPVLLLHGLLDEVIPYEHSEKLFAACPSLGKRLRLVPDADHIHFEEPVDTVQPIATFLKENLRPNNNVEIGPIPPENFACPVSVLNREVLAKGHGLGADGQEMRSCSVVESMFSWVFDVSNALVEGGSVVASGSSAIASTSLSVVTETFGNSFASVEDLKQETDVEEEKKVAAENSEPKHRHITMPSPEKGSPLYNGNRGSNSNSYPSSSSKQGGSATDATVKIDMHILSSYFEALNRQDLLAVVGFLDQDIAVRFTDDSRRNWSSSSVAFEKFFAMFKDMPDLKVAYNVLDVKHDDYVTKFVTSCNFSSELTKTNTKRTIVFAVSHQTKKIVLMEHVRDRH